MKAAMRLALLLTLAALPTACVGGYPPSTSYSQFDDPDDPGPPRPMLWPMLGLGPDPTLPP
jgi:hypothetical protein